MTNRYEVVLHAMTPCSATVEIEAPNPAQALILAYTQIALKRTEFMRQNNVVFEVDDPVWPRNITVSSACNVDDPLDSIEVSELVQREKSP